MRIYLDKRDMSGTKLEMKLTELVTALMVLSSFYLSPQSMAYSHGILTMFIVTTLFATLLIHYSVKDLRMEFNKRLILS